MIGSTGATVTIRGLTLLVSVAVALLFCGCPAKEPRQIHPDEFLLGDGIWRRKVWASDFKVTPSKCKRNGNLIECPT
jgi:hypothetical protein